MSDTLKKCIFYFNATALSISYFFLSLLFAVSAMQSAPESLQPFLETAIKPVNFLLEPLHNSMDEVSGQILYLIALLLPVIISVLTPIFLRKELSKHTALLLSLSFILPLGFFLTIIADDSLLSGFELAEYILFSILSLLFIAYGITTLVFMHKDNDVLDW